MWPGMKLTAGDPNHDTLWSCDGVNKMFLGTDGGFAVYTGNPAKAVWWIRREDGAKEVVMQADGNFIAKNAAGNQVWAADTWGNPGAYVVVHDAGWHYFWAVHRADGHPLYPEQAYCADPQTNPCEDMERRYACVDQCRPIVPY